MAAASGNIKLIRLLLAAGYPADTKGSYLKYKPGSCALDYPMTEDVVGGMNLLRSGTKLSVMQLMKMAAKHNASKCFISLLKEAERSVAMTSDVMGEVYHAATSSGAEVLKQLIKSGYQDFNRRCSECCNSTPLHTAGSRVSLHTYERQIVSRNLQHFLDVSEILLTHGVKASVYNIHGQLPIDILIVQNHDAPRNTAQFISAVRILLNAMRQESPGKELVLPCSSVISLQHVFHHVLFTADVTGGRMLAPLVQVLQMILQKGVNLSTGEDRSYSVQDRCKCGYNDYFSAPHPLFHLHRCWNATLLQHCINIRRNVIEEPFILFNTLLLVYGAVPDASCFEYLASIMQVTTTSRMMELIGYFMTLMSEPDIFRFRQYLASRNIDESSISDKFNKSFKEYCRFALYTHIRDRRMAAHVHTLPLPNEIKKYLVFDS